MVIGGTLSRRRWSSNDRHLRRIAHPDTAICDGSPTQTPPSTTGHPLRHRHLRRVTHSDTTIYDGSASSHEPVQQALQFSGWVGGEAAVHRTRLDDGAARGLEEAEPDAEVLACDLAERGVAAADACHELEPPAHGGPVDARVES